VSLQSLGFYDTLIIFVYNKNNNNNNNNNNNTPDVVLQPVRYAQDCYSNKAIKTSFQCNVVMGNYNKAVLG